MGAGMSVCARCGKEFPGGNGKFCSVTCWLLIFGIPGGGKLWVRS
jgi:hypothetical protein